MEMLKKTCLPQKKPSLPARRAKLLALLCLVWTFSLACGLLSPAEDAATQTPVPVQPALPSTALPEAPNANCVPPGNQAALPPGNFEQYDQAILQFLNRGGSLESLDNALYEAGVAAQPTTVADGDLTGDGAREVVVSLFDPASQKIPPQGKLLIYRCTGSQYELAVRRFPPPEWGAPQIRMLADLNADGQVELVTAEASCGAHTCFEQISVVMWMGDAFENRLSGATDDLPYPTLEAVDPDGDGVYDLQVTGGGFGSVGAGPQRNLVRTWQFDQANQGWFPAGEELSASNYRIHVLHDADAAAARSDWEAALMGYQRVISDTTLQEWGSPQAERAQLAAYARFRLVEVYSLRGQVQFASEVLAKMQSSYPPEEPLSGYVELAETFTQAYSEGGTATACRAVEQYATRHEAQLLTGLGQETFGYGNPAYTPEMLCPW